MFNQWKIRIAVSQILETIQRDQSCDGSLDVNTSVDGQSDHGEQISNVFTVFLNNDGVSELIGWEYQTYGGQEYFQLSGTFSLGVSGGLTFVQISAAYSASAPIVPFTGSVYSAVQTIEGTLGFAGKALPFPFNTLTAANANVRKSDCYTGG